MTTAPDLVLHVGMPRASSIIVPALQRLHPQLRGHGIAYVDAAQLERLPHVSGWQRDRLTRHEHTDRFERELAALIRAEQRRAGNLWRRHPVSVVLAGDQLLGRGEIGLRDAQHLRPYATSAVSQVVRAVSARNVRIVVHTHRQDRLLELAYLRRLHSGQHATIEQYFPTMFKPVHDYRDLLTRLSSVPHVCDVVVRPVELADAGVHAFVNDMLGVIGLRDALDLHVMGADLLVYPPVYSTRGATLARALNPLVRGAEFTLLQKFLTGKYSAPAEYGPPDILDPGARARVLNSYAESNRRLYSEYMPDLPADSYADDDATFALGNVLHPPARRDTTIANRLTVAAAVPANRASITLFDTARRVGRRLPPEQRQRVLRLRRRFGRLT